jgi:hypothetical protein
MRPRFLGGTPAGYAITHYRRRSRLSRIVRFLIDWFSWN